jgi:hypothetical protein
MKVTSVTIFANDEEAVHLGLHPSGPGAKYYVKTIIGMDAEELTPKFYGFSKDRSQRFYDFKMKPRDLVFRVVLNPNFVLRESYSDIRDDLYRIISRTRHGQLRLVFESEAAKIAEIYGHIIKFEVAYFSEVPELQLTIRCQDYMFRGITPVVYTDAVLVNSGRQVVVDNMSTAPHGFSMKFTVTTTGLTQFKIQDKFSDPTWEFILLPPGVGANFFVGDEVFISSEFTDRYVYVLRSSVELPIVDRVTPESVWPLVFPGFNEFYMSDLTKLDLDRLEFRAAFWGV